jgi:hypothetical protein
MKVWMGMLAAMLGVASALLAANPPEDPLSLLERRAAETRAATGPEIFLSPSTRGSQTAELDLAIHKALQFLEIGQHDNGSWDRVVTSITLSSFQPKKESDALEKDAAEADTEHIADTSLSAETLMLAVNSGREPDLAPQCLKAIDYLCQQIKKWEGDRIYIQKRTLDPLHDPHPLRTDIRFYDSTVDTFFTFRFLCETRDRITDPNRKARVQYAIDVLLTKIVKCQDIHGTWLDEADPMAGQGFHKDRTEVEEYNTRAPNIVTHCVALSAINIAARSGVTVPVETRYRAENYLRDALAQDKLRCRTGPDCVLIVAIAAADTEVYETCRALLKTASSPAPQTSAPTVDELNVLRTHATQAKQNLRSIVNTMIAMETIPTSGPALDALPEALKGVKMIAGGDGNNFLSRVSTTLIKHQGADGHIDATIGQPMARDDDTFGTATSARLLMAVAAAKDDPPLTTQP